MSAVLQPNGVLTEVKHCTVATRLFLVSVINGNSIIWAAINITWPAIGRPQSAGGGREMPSFYSAVVKHIWSAGSMPGLPSARETWTYCSKSSKGLLR